MVAVVAFHLPRQQCSALSKARLVIVLLLSFILVAFVVACQPSLSLFCIPVGRVPMTIMHKNLMLQMIVPPWHCHPMTMWVLSINICGLCCHCHHLATNTPCPSCKWQWWHHCSLPPCWQPPCRCHRCSHCCCCLDVILTPLIGHQCAPPLDHHFMARKSSIAPSLMLLSSGGGAPLMLSATTKQRWMIPLTAGYLHWIPLGMEHCCFYHRHCCPLLHDQLPSIFHCCLPNFLLLNAP